MVTVSVLAILLALAVPSFVMLVKKHRLSSSAGNLLSDMQLARSEAIRLNSRVVLCRSTAGTGCDGTDWGSWMMFVDANRDGSYGSGDTLVRIGSMHRDVSATSNVATVMFRPDGFSYTSAGALSNATVNVCVQADSLSSNQRNVRLIGGSSMTIDDPGTSVTCL